jgi:hypothetical protein
MIMNIDAFTQILETHGAVEANWPEETRAACRHLTATSQEAQQLLLQFMLLEQSLDALDQPHFPGLETRILHQALPPQQLSLSDRLINWLIPKSGSPLSLWRPTLAACLPLGFGILVGNLTDLGAVQDSSEYQYWDDELIMLSFNDYSDSEYLP